MVVSTATNSLATAITYPLEMLKTKMQIRSEGIGIRQKSMYGGYNPFQIYDQLYRAGYGTSSLWTGFGAGFISRIGGLFVRNLVYKMIYDQWKPRKPTNDLTYDEKKLLAGFAGACGAIFANPFEIAMVRQISDLGRPEQFKRNYADVGAAYEKISAEKPTGIWRGLTAHLIKAVLLNIVMIGPYDQMSERMWNVFGDTYINKPFAILWASLFGTVFTLPFDNIKTRMQNQFVDKSLNRMNYTGFVNAITQAFYTESSNTFMVGFYTYYAKVVLYATVTLYSTDMIFDVSRRNSGLKPEYI
jgi:solute carrier family 25 oxoglutarate transporter 11